MVAPRAGKTPGRCGLPLALAWRPVAGSVSSCSAAVSSSQHPLVLSTRGYDPFGFAGRGGSPARSLRDRSGDSTPGSSTSRWQPCRPGGLNGAGARTAAGAARAALRKSLGNASRSRRRGSRRAPPRLPAPLPAPLVSDWSDGSAKQPSRRSTSGSKCPAGIVRAGSVTGHDPERGIVTGGLHQLGDTAIDGLVDRPHRPVVRWRQQ
jgi:hypothetical protein